MHKIATQWQQYAEELEQYTNQLRNNNEIQAAENQKLIDIAQQIARHKLADMSKAEKALIYQEALSAAHESVEIPDASEGYEFQSGLVKAAEKRSNESRKTKGAAVGGAHAAMQSAKKQGTGIYR